MTDAVFSKEEAERQTPSAPPQPQRRRRVFRIVLPLLILVVGIAGGTYLKATGPEVGRRPPARQVPLVETEAMRPGMESVRVEAMGTVIPARELELKSQVGGEIVALHPNFVAGGFMRQGEEVLKIDPADYELAVAQKQSAVVNTRYALKLELGHQDVARREWELLRDEGPVNPLDEELALRKPHLAKVRADLEAAEADLAKARLDLARTRLVAPFNAVVLSENVEKGSMVTSQETLATLVGTDAYWVRVSLPVDRLEWVRLPGSGGRPGSPVKIIYAGGFEREGEVIRLLSDLAPEGRLARVLVEVKDPLDLKHADGQRPPLLIGEYVRVEITGDEMPGIFRIPRAALRDGTRIWVAAGDDTLDIRPVTPVWGDSTNVFLDAGLAAGERLVVSDLPTAVPGMALRVRPAGEPAVTPPTPSGEVPAPAEDERD